MAARAVLSLFLLSLIVFVNTAPFTGYCLPLCGLQQLGCYNTYYKRLILKYLKGIV